MENCTKDCNLEQAMDFSELPDKSSLTFKVILLLTPQVILTFVGAFWLFDRVGQHKGVYGTRP
jgi:hypothetical protein